MVTIGTNLVLKWGSECIFPMFWSVDFSVEVCVAKSSRASLKKHTALLLQLQWSNADLVWEISWLENLGKVFALLSNTFVFYQEWNFSGFVLADRFF